MSARKQMLLAVIIFFVSFFLILAWFVIPTFAAEANVTWTYGVTEEGQILGYRIYESDDTPHVQHIEPTSRTATIIAEECTTFYMVAYDQYVESDHSNSLVFCPGQLMVPGDFVREVIFTVNRPSGEEALAYIKKKWKEEKK